MDLYYDEDNFSGRHNRGTRYAIYVNGILERDNLSDNEVDYFAEYYERMGYFVEVKEM